MNLINKVKQWILPGRGIANMSDATMGYDFMTISGFLDFPDVTIDFDKYSGIAESYNRCSTIATIINRNSQALINGKWWIVDKKENDVIKKYKGISSLLNQPNPLQSWKELITQLDVYRQLYGETYLYAVVPEGYDIQDAAALWVLDPNYINIESTGKMVLQSSLDDIITRYIYKNGFESLELDKRCLLHIRDTHQNINFSPSSLRGVSRITGLKNAIRNIIQAEEAVYALNRNRGAQGILSNDSSDAIGHVPLSPEEKLSIETKLKSHYGMRISQSPVIITDKNLKWQQMSFNIKDLMLFEGIESNIKRVAEAYNYPFELLNTENIAYTNKVEAKREHYQSNIIPLSLMYAEKFSVFFGLDRDSFIIDFSDVECLKKSEQDKANTLNTANQAMRIAYEKGIVSLAEWRLAVGMDEEIYKPESNENQIRDEKRVSNPAEEGDEQADNDQRDRD